jgi:amino acid transporter
VNPNHGTPGPAIWAIVVASLAAMLWTGAVTIVTSLSTVALYLAYVIPVVLGFRAISNSDAWTASAVWSLGKYGKATNIVAILYTGFICCVLVMPPNELAGKTLAGVLALLALVYWFIVRRGFSGPEWARSSGPERAHSASELQP